MKNILVALELQDEAMSKKIIASAKELALAFNAKCWLVHIAAPEPDFVGYQVGPHYIREMLAEDLRSDHKEIQAYAEDLRKANVNVEGLMIQGPTVEMISEEVQKLNIDLLILGNKHHGMLYSVFVGSVTDELIDSLDVPVFLVPDNDQK